MASKPDLQEELVNILGNNRVYYQAPENIKLTYPCIIFDLNTGSTTFADNKPYLFKKQYSITAITVDADDDLAYRIAKHFPMSRFNRHYISDNLYHDVINVYY